MSKKHNGAEPDKMPSMDARVSFAASGPKQRPAPTPTPVQKIKPNFLARILNRRVIPVDEGSADNRRNDPALPLSGKSTAREISENQRAATAISAPSLPPTELEKHRNKQFGKMNDNRAGGGDAPAESVGVTSARQEVPPPASPVESALNVAEALPLLKRDAAPPQEEPLPPVPVSDACAPVPVAQETEIIAAPTAESIAEGYETFKQSGGKYFSVTRFAIAGSDNHGYEDAADFDADMGRAAVADGTTLGGRSEIVAQSLVRGFIHGPHDGDYDLSDAGDRAAWWMETRMAWYRVFDEEFNQASAIQQVKWSRGGSSTFTGLQLSGDGDKHRLFHVGDCSVLWFAEGVYIYTDGATSHNAHPDVLHTEQDAPNVLTVSNWLDLPGDTALLCTDALAKYLLTRKDEAGLLHEFETCAAENFVEWTNGLRAAGELDSDDYTALIVRFKRAEGEG